VARKAQLDFAPQTRKRPVTSPASSIELVAKRSSAAAKQHQGLYGKQHDACYHWGLDE
jgi:hypothetical protein